MLWQKLCWIKSTVQSGLAVLQNSFLYLSTQLPSKFCRFLQLASLAVEDWGTRKESARYVEDYGGTSIHCGTTFAGTYNDPKAFVR